MNHQVAEFFQFDDIVKATGAAAVRDDFVSKLSRITQLTGEPDRTFREEL